MGVNVAYALMFLYAPLTIGIVNLGKLREKTTEITELRINNITPYIVLVK